MKIKIEHVALIVSDMDASIEYYSTLFGFELRTRGQSPTREMAFLFNRNQPGMEIELIRDLDPTQHTYSDKGIVNHLAFTVDNMEKAISHYRAKGIQFQTEQPNTSIDGGKNIFFYGPNRELLQLVQPASLL